MTVMLGISELLPWFCSARRSISVGVLLTVLLIGGSIHQAVHL